MKDILGVLAAAGLASLLTAGLMGGWSNAVPIPLRGEAVEAARPSPQLHAIQARLEAVERMLDELASLRDAERQMVQPSPRPELGGSEAMAAEPGEAQPVSDAAPQTLESPPTGLTPDDQVALREVLAARDDERQAVLLQLRSSELTREEREELRAELEAVGARALAELARRVGAARAEEIRLANAKLFGVRELPRPAKR